MLPCADEVRSISYTCALGNMFVVCCCLILQCGISGCQIAGAPQLTGSELPPPFHPHSRPAAPPVDVPIQALDIPNHLSKQNPEQSASEQISDVIVDEIAGESTMTPEFSPVVAVEYERPDRSEIIGQSPVIHRHDAVKTIYRMWPLPFDRRFQIQRGFQRQFMTRELSSCYGDEPLPILLAGFEDENPERSAAGADTFPPRDADEIPDFYGETLSGDDVVLADTVWDQFKLDAPEYLPGVWEDTKAIVNWHNAAWVLGATGVALSLRGEADDSVRRATTQHPDRWGEGSHILGTLGEVQWQVPVIALVYSNSVWTNDAYLYDFSKSLISAYTISSVGTVIIKGIANTERPSKDWNDGEFGFPSYHTSSSFTVAAVIEEYYGIEKAVPWYVLAGLIGWSRIDERDHDLSDVVFGAMFGYIIGKSVAASHLHDDPRVRIRPTYSQVDESYGVLFETSY